MVVFQASAGLCDAASRSSANIHIDGEEGRETRILVEKAIAKCRQTPSTNTAKYGRAKNDMEFFRRCAEVFGEVALPVDNLQEAERVAAKYAAPERAAAWRQIAWAYQSKGNAVDARRSIAACLNANDIPKPNLFKHLNILSAAALYLELGDTDSARRLARQAEADAGPFQTPLLVAILVSLGEVQRAVSIIVKLSDEDTDFAVEALGTLCVKEGKVGDVEKELQSISSQRVKAVLCAAIAARLTGDPYVPRVRGRSTRVANIEN